MDPFHCIFGESRIATHFSTSDYAPMNTHSQIPEPVEKALRARDAQAVLDESIRAFGCQAGTVHWLDAQSGMLRLAAHRNIPETIVQLVATVPIGKGIAGLAAQNREPVSLCNLQTDTSEDDRNGRLAGGPNARRRRIARRARRGNGRGARLERRRKIAAARHRRATRRGEAVSAVAGGMRAVHGDGDSE
jgi:hypothetical protein